MKDGIGLGKECFDLKLILEGWDFKVKQEGWDDVCLEGCDV